MLWFISVTKWNCFPLKKSCNLVHQKAKTKNQHSTVVLCKKLEGLYLGTDGDTQVPGHLSPEIHAKSTPDTCGPEVARGMLAIRIGFPTSSQPHKNPSLKDNPAFTSYRPQAVRSREKVLFSMLNSKRQHMDGCMIQTCQSSFGDSSTTGVHKVRPHLMQSGSAGLHLGLITHTSTASCCAALPAGAILSAWLRV